MSNFYEDILLREEYNLVVKLQKDIEFSKYVNVRYEDRITGEKNNVAVSPTANKYPEKYIVDYRMPVFVAYGQLRRDWHGVITIELSESVLKSRNANNGPHVTLQSNFTPFNNHVRNDSICSGNAWVVAKDFGLWHFIISIGALINQDEFVCADAAHFNGSAYTHWVDRKRKPVNNIKWPLDLISNKHIDIIKKNTSTNEKKQIKIILKAKVSDVKMLKIIKKK